MIKAVIFDLDGTLLNRDASVQKFIAGQYDRMNKLISHIPKEKYTSRFIELDCRGYVWKDKVYQQLVDEFTITAITWESLLQDYLDQFKNSCIPFPHLISMLKGLKSKSIKLGIITNGKGQFQIDNINALGIKTYFETIIVSEWEGVKKPDPLIFKKALEQLNVSPDESIYVGDHPENDVSAAQKAGMKGIWKKDSQWGSLETDFIIDDLAELPLIMERIWNECRKSF
ncbi:HAD family hydrolase [Bacillus sp. V2I10]|uniref:HAD family hydrolase n=1 Tax=Bacillus sp. V2I10 TaxID=3042276 RepID=UPI002784C3DB|nr:HAD family hydrolase [Bacillus sp. V2I10]MDQ0857768.1 putative hydrolase of the HAD superfamily [Bacillus sp. V2I10]